MNARTLRKLAIKAFRKYDFALAAKLFSLAYEKKPSNEFLLFIELCSLALDDEEGVWSLFDVYVDNINLNQEENLKTIIEIIETSNYKNIRQIENINGVSYHDFLEIAKKTGEFVKTFENITHSSKLIISSKDELADFIERLIDHGFADLAAHYMEDPAWSMSLAHLAPKLKAKSQQRQRDEN